MPPDPRDRISRAAFTRTVPAVAFAPDELAAHVRALDARGGDGARPSLPGGSTAGSGRRFVAGDLIGLGATGRVYAAVDRDLEREVAVKVLSEERAGIDDARSFVDEARLTASLSHPNVLPVHDLGRDDHGRVFFTMKRIAGRSLADAIDRSAPEAPEAPLHDANAIVSVFIDVCQALAYAHHRRIVHQDVKPANIMLGDFGEVLLVDWGSAGRLDGGAAPRIYGTPLYMSPEQARRERVDERSDVYGVGATLFHALTLRLPTWHDDGERFFAMKRIGAFAPPTAEERARVPAALIDIALKALSAKPDDRYDDANAILADLRAYQSGLAVRAHREGAFERLARWHRRHTAAVWCGAAAVAMALALAGALYREHLRRLDGWGDPVIEERFEDDSWTTRWRPSGGAFVRQDGRIVSVGHSDSTIFLDRKLWGPIAVEYDAEMLPGCAPCDLSLVWCRDLKRRPDGASVEPVDEYHLQFGANNGAYSTIINRGRQLACSYVRPEHGRRYRVRCEVADERLTLMIDGEKVCEWIDQIRFDGGYIGLYGHFPGKAFDDVTVSVRGIAQDVPATAIGDAMVRADQLDLAVEQYARVAQSHQGRALAEEALYKLGLCRWRQRRYADAEAAWAPLADSSWSDELRLNRIDRTFDAGDHDGVIAELEDLAGAADPTTRARAGMRWAAAVDHLMKHDGIAEIPRYLDMHARRLSDQATLDAAASSALLHVGRPQEVLARFPRQRLRCCYALRALGRPREIVERYPDQHDAYEWALLECGLAELIEPTFARDPYAMGLCERGLAADALAFIGEEHNVAVRALCQLGRVDEAVAALDRFGLGPSDQIRVHALSDGIIPTFPESASEAQVWILLVGDDAAAARSKVGTEHWLSPAIDAALAIDAAARDDHEQAALLARRLSSHSYATSAARFIASFAVPFLRGSDARDWSAFDAACAAIAEDAPWPQQQRPWHDARYLRGAIDEAAFLAQPHRAFAEATLLVRRAMRHERASDPAAAIADYRAWQELPAWRRSYDPDPALTRFVALRIGALAR
ncbi:MAG TPA: serine/threonine-protein kinase [Planctomycetota bacterium]|nr:serine/threonine-protein kinase [Planctomycetota bacterium]